MPDREKVIGALINGRVKAGRMGLNVIYIGFEIIDEIIALLKEQEADIIAMSRFLESHGWDSDSICGKNVEIVVTNGDDGDA